VLGFVYVNARLSCLLPCAVFSLDPRTSDLEYEITDLLGVNLFSPPPLPFLTYLGPETLLLGSLLFGRLSSLLGPKLRPGWEAKFSFGLSSGEPKGSMLGPCVLSCV